MEGLNRNNHGARTYRYPKRELVTRDRLPQTEGDEKDSDTQPLHKAYAHY